MVRALQGAFSQSGADDLCRRPSSTHWSAAGVERKAISMTWSSAPRARLMTLCDPTIATGSAPNVNMLEVASIRHVGRSILSPTRGNQINNIVRLVPCTMSSSVLSCTLRRMITSRKDCTTSIGKPNGSESIWPRWNPRMRTHCFRSPIGSGRFANLASKRTNGIRHNTQASFRSWAIRV